MFSTYLIYTLLLGVLICYGASVCKKKIDRHNFIWACVFLLIFGFLEGARYNVGTDWENYKDNYLNLKKGTSSLNLNLNGSYEPLFQLVTLAFAKINVSQHLYFGFLSIMIVLLLTLAFRRNPRYMIWVMFLYTTNNLIQSQNIIRQSLSVAIVIFAVSFLVSGNRIKYLLLCIIASLFHVTSIIALPFVFVGNRLLNFLDNVWVGLCLFIASFFGGEYLINQAGVFIPLMTENKKYLHNLNHLDIVHEYNSGLGLLFTISISILIIIFYRKIKISNNSNVRIDILYRIFLIGSVFQNAFANSMFLGRVALALVGVKIFLLPLLYEYFWNKNIYLRLLLILIVIITVLGYYLSIASNAGGCAPFIIAL